MTQYRTIEELIDMVDELNRTICHKILQDNRKLFEVARGSTHNHQTWDGGYIDHVTDGMNFAVELYGTLFKIDRPIPFSLSDSLLVFFLHDIEKPWRIMIAESDEVVNRPGLETKEQFREFRESKLAEYGLVLTDAQYNALTYVEGEYKDYSSKRRVMNELAGFCHIVDVYSARIAHDYPQEGDPWAQNLGRVRIAK